MVDIDATMPQGEERSPASAKGFRAKRAKLLALGAGAVLGLGVLFDESAGALAVQAFDRVTDAYLVVWIESAGSAIGCF